MRVHNGVAVVLALSFASLGCQAFSASSTSVGTSSTATIVKDFGFSTEERLPWIQEGYNTWKWNGNDINYVEMGDKSKPALLLIHGFGASSYHWRFNIPELAKDYHVYAFCKLGFGLSSKPVQDYTAEVWRDQTVSFLKEVIGKPTTVAGNSIGGLTALYAAATDEAKPLVNGCVLLNCAGQFRDPDAILEPEETNEFVEKMKEFAQRLVIGASFLYTKQPARIEQVLRQVYPQDDSNVDAELVESIRYPSLDPNAAEVFYRVISKGGKKPVIIDDLLGNLECPLLLCWGQKDPWIRPAAADKIQALYPKSQRVNIDAGHCPQDENPQAVNAAIKNFMMTKTS
jgi:pimeloyl-ACP methyl ester carboxylesterase